jgi:hypothetical protein
VGSASTAISAEIGGLVAETQPLTYDLPNASVRPICSLILALEGRHLVLCVNETGIRWSV